MDRNLPGASTNRRCLVPRGTSANPESATRRRRLHIDALPEDVLRQIVSKLSLKEAGRTTVLSSSWREIWGATRLVLDDVGGLARPDGDAPVDTVSSIVAAHQGPFFSVHLTSPDLDPFRCVVREWFRAFARKQLQDLVMVNGGAMPIPIEILQCSSLARLHLGGGQFPYTGRYFPVLFPEMLELGFWATRMNERDLDRLLAGCPKLERLVFACYRMQLSRVELACENLRSALFWHSVPGEELLVADAPRLQRLVLWWDKDRIVNRHDLITVKMGCSPLLTAVGYLSPRLHMLQIRGTDIKVGTVANPGVQIPSVKVLAVDLRFGDENDERMVISFLKCFPCVETLHIKSGKSMYQPLMTILNGNLWRNIGSIQCVRAHIMKIIFYDLCANDSELSLIKYTLESARALNTLGITFSDDIPIGKEYDAYERLATAVLAAKWASSNVKIYRLYENEIWSYKAATDLSRSDPFDYLPLEGGMLLNGPVQVAPEHNA